jgi:hypothetical protein
MRFDAILLEISGDTRVRTHEDTDSFDAERTLAEPFAFGGSRGVSNADATASKCLLLGLT